MGGNIRENKREIFGLSKRVVHIYHRMSTMFLYRVDDVLIGAARSADTSYWQVVVYFVALLQVLAAS